MSGAGGSSGSKSGMSEAIDQAIDQLTSAASTRAGADSGRDERPEDIEQPERASGDVIRWWWVRHAPAIAGGFVGWSDINADLSDTHSLSTLKMALPEDAALLASDLTRAAQTAEALSRRTWVRMAPQATLREQHFGEWEGRPFDSLNQDEAAAFWSEPAHARPPGGESFADLCDRVSQTVISHLTGEHSDIVAVAHAGTVRAALTLALGLEPSQALVFEIAPLSLTRIDWLATHRGWRVGCVNVAL